MASAGSGLFIWELIDIVTFGQDIMAFIGCPGFWTGVAVVVGAIGVLPGITAIGWADNAGRPVIGKLDDITDAKLRPGENTLRKHLEGDLGSPKENWKRNSSVLRTEMNKGVPIRDASVDPNTGALLNNTGFLGAERNLLENRGWTYNPSTTLWSPPVK